MIPSNALKFEVVVLPSISISLYTPLEVLKDEAILAPGSFLKNPPYKVFGVLLVFQKVFC